VALIARRYVQGLIDHGVPGLALNNQLIDECHGQESALIPAAVFTQLHQAILLSKTFETLIAMRDRIFRDIQVSYSLNDYVRYVSLLNP
jgi:hypothetical protein